MEDEQDHGPNRMHSGYIYLGISMLCFLVSKEQGDVVAHSNIHVYTFTLPWKALGSGTS